MHVRISIHEQIDQSCPNVNRAPVLVQWAHNTSANHHYWRTLQTRAAMDLLALPGWSDQLANCNSIH